MTNLMNHILLVLATWECMEECVLDDRYPMSEPGIIEPGMAEGL